MKNISFENIDRQIATLRAELELIRSESRMYFAREHHSELHKLQQERRRLRVVGIKEELRSMLKNKPEQN